MHFFHHIGFYALGLLIIMVTAFVIQTRREGMRGRRFAVSLWAYLFGTFVTVSLAAHNIKILWQIVPYAPVSYGTKPAYDFHFYALILFGAVMMVQGIALMKAARSLGFEGDKKAVAPLVRHTLIVLVLSAPLIPIKFFGTVTTILALINLAALAFLNAKAFDGRRATTRILPVHARIPTGIYFGRHG